MSGFSAPRARWGVILIGLSCSLLVSCASKVRPLTGPPLKGDLLAASRQWRQETSVPEARDRLTQALREEDDSRGKMERAVAKANADKSWHVPRSIASLPLEQRARTGIFLVLGFKQRTGNKPLMVRTIVEDLCAKGWHARLVELGEWSSPETNSAIIHDLMKKELPKLDRVVMVGFSKGGCDWAHWVQNQARELPPAQREKVRLSLQFAPILRGSAAAKWMSEAEGPVAGYLRGKMRRERKEDQQGLSDVASIANDPWVEHDMPDWRSLFPKLTAVHYVAIPDDAKGRPTVPKNYRLFSTLVNHDFRWSGPMDGLVESAAQVFPPGESTPQWIVRVKGSHMILDGVYVEGGRDTSKLGRLDDEKEGWRGGLEVMDDLLRALPRSAVGW